MPWVPIFGTWQSTNLSRIGFVAQEILETIPRRAKADAIRAL
jgi:hypothetical protein